MQKTPKPTHVHEPTKAPQILKEPTKAHQILKEPSQADEHRAKQAATLQRVSVPSPETSLEGASPPISRKEADSPPNPKGVSSQILRRHNSWAPLGQAQTYTGVWLCLGQWR